MLERTTPPPEDFLPVQTVCVLYVVFVLGLSVGIVRHGLPVTTGVSVPIRIAVPVNMGVYVFVAVSAVFFVPLFPVLRRLHPERSGR